jgi:hypothetical protein
MAMKKFVVTLLVLSLCLVAYAGEVECRKTISGTPDYESFLDDTYAIADGAALSVENMMGDVEVVAGDGREVRLQALIQVKGDRAEEFGKKIRVEVDGGSDPFSIRTHYPDWDDVELSFGVSLKIWLPAGHSLAAKNSFGNIAVRGLRGDVTATAASGSIDVECVVGAMKLSSSFGSLKLLDSAGAAAVSAMSGSVEVRRHRRGNLDIAGKFGDVKVEDVAGDIRIECVSGDVAVKKAGGDVEVESNFGNIVLSDAAGKVRVSSTSGGLKARLVKGGLEADVAFGNVKAEDVRGGCKVRNKSGSVTVGKVSGDVDVESRFGSVTVDGADGSIVIRGASGNVDVKGLSYTGRKGGETSANRFDISTSFGTIEIALPDPPSFRLDAAATFGRIKSDFELIGLQKGLNSMKCVCSVGAGEAEVLLRSKSGNIEIEED